MRWDLYSQRWKLTTRALPKMHGEWVQGIIAPLGEFVTDGSAEQPRFVGYMLDEQDPRPAMIWSAGQQPFQIEGGFIDAVSDRDADALDEGPVTRRAGPAPPRSG